MSWYRESVNRFEQNSGPASREHYLPELLTKEHRLIAKDGETLRVPSVWTMEEKGMALAMGMPFLLLLEEAIHNDFWPKTLLEKVHYSFNDHNYLENSRAVSNEVANRYEELVLQAQVERLA